MLEDQVFSLGNANHSFHRCAPWLR
jgi:hypothetical protein